MDTSTYWHVTLTVAGRPVSLAQIHDGLECLSFEHPFLLSGRYAVDHAEVHYWEEAPEAETVADLALSLWPEHQASAGLPDWHVVGLEVLERVTYRLRCADPRAPLSVVGLAPFD